MNAEDANKSEDFLARARRRFEQAAEDEKSLREEFISDLKFAAPDGKYQWDPQVKMQREQAGRPAMSFPRCHVFVQQVSNEARQKKPEIKFAPRLDADKDTAEVYEGLARFIQYTSDAQVAYETAVENSAGGSFGYFRFMTDYVDDEGDELELKILPVLDPLTVYGVLIPACFNRKALSAFVIEDISREEYKMLYPDTELASLSWPDAEKRYDGWVGSETVRIAEYWWVEEVKREGKRPTMKVQFCKTNGFEILPGADGESSKTEWPGTVIPIVPVLGKLMIMEGRPNLFSVVRPQKSAQQLINYSKSRIAETLSTAPISPFMAAVGQIPSGKEAQWQNLNKINTPVLEYNPIDAGGRPVGPPQRQTFEPPIASLSAFVGQEIDDMKATTGIYDASLGNQGNETSGQAIARRQAQSNVTNMHFMDNLERAFRKGGEIIASLIPKIYDTKRMIQILGPDEAMKVVTINAPHVDENGKERHYDLTKGKYDVVVTMGRAFSTKRMESFDTMQQLVQTAPNLLPMFGDILFMNSDLAGADIVAERFKRMLPPNLADSEENAQIPPQAQAQMQQLGQQNQALNAYAQKIEQELQQAQFQLKAKVVDHQGQMEIEKMRAATALAVAEMNASKDSNEAIAKAEIARMQIFGDLEKQKHSQAHDIAKQAHQHAHEDIVRASQPQEQAQPKGGAEQEAAPAPAQV